MASDDRQPSQEFFEGLDFGYLHRMTPPIKIQAWWL